MVVIIIVVVVYRARCCCCYCGGRGICVVVGTGRDIGVVVVGKGGIVIGVLLLLWGMGDVDWLVCGNMSQGDMSLLLLWGESSSAWGDASLLWGPGDTLSLVWAGRDVVAAVVGVHLWEQEGRMEYLGQTRDERAKVGTDKGQKGEFWVRRWL